MSRVSSLDFIANIIPFYSGSKWATYFFFSQINSKSRHTLNKFRLKLLESLNRKEIGKCSIEEIFALPHLLSFCVVSLKQDETSEYFQKQQLFQGLINILTERPELKRIDCHFDIKLQILSYEKASEILEIQKLVDLSKFKIFWELTDFHSYQGELNQDL